MNFLRWLYRWGCLAVIPAVTPASRILIILAENRTATVASESRITIVPAEPRTTNIPEA